jgi:hypothetical protein
MRKIVRYFVKLPQAYSAWKALDLFLDLHKSERHARRKNDRKRFLLS